MFKPNMATRNPVKTNVNVHNSTEFQLHKSHVPIFASIIDKVLDYTEYRLVRYAKQVQDPQQKAVLLDLIAKYRKGLVAVAWRGGMPIWLPVTKDT